jgi:hypothetical protein
MTPAAHRSPRTAATPSLLSFFLADSILCGIACSMTMPATSSALHGVGGGASRRLPAELQN